MRTGIFTTGKRLAACALPAFALALAGCVPGGAERGARNAAELPRIVSLNPCIDAVLVEVADPDQILALSHYSRDPAGSSIPAIVAQNYPTSGGTVEEVLALDPDLVLADTFLAPSTRQALADLGIPARFVGIASTPEESIVQVHQIAGLAGQEARGEELAQRIEAALAEGATPPGTPTVSAVLWQPGQIVPGEATLASELMRRAGFGSQSAARGMGQADYLSLEALLADPTEVLLVAGDARAQRHPALSRLKATRVESFDPALLYCGGPTIIRAMARLGEIRAEGT